jgi:regulator of protease activity HflC (stomatin/prohibitin superfamily)
VSQPLTVGALAALDQPQSLSDLQRFSPAAFAQGLAEEVAGGEETLADLGARLDALQKLLEAVDRFAQKAMGIHLNHVLATAPVPPQLRTLLMTTVNRYVGDLDLLRSRVQAATARISTPTLTEDILGAAAQVLALRAEVRAVVLEQARQLAQARLPAVQRGAKDRLQGEAERKRFRLAKADLELILAQPARIEQANFEARLHALPLPEEEPEPVVEPSADVRFSLLEID